MGVVAQWVQHVLEATDTEVGFLARTCLIGLCLHPTCADHAEQLVFQTPWNVGAHKRPPTLFNWSDHIAGTISCLNELKPTYTEREC